MPAGSVHAETSPVSLPRRRSKCLSAPVEGDEGLKEEEKEDEAEKETMEKRSRKTWKENARIKNDKKIKITKIEKEKKWQKEKILGEDEKKKMQRTRHKAGTASQK